MRSRLLRAAVVAIALALAPSMPAREVTVSRLERIHIVMGQGGRINIWVVVWVTITINLPGIGPMPFEP